MDTVKLSLYEFRHNRKNNWFQTIEEEAIYKMYFIRSKGKFELKTYHLINWITHEILDISFSSKKEAEKYAKENSLLISPFSGKFKMQE